MAMSGGVDSSVAAAPFSCFASGSSFFTASGAVASASLFSNRASFMVSVAAGRGGSLLLANKWSTG